jgi:hypothetical protein
MPSLNQAEYDYLHAFARSRRSYRPGGPYAVSPEDPHPVSEAIREERAQRVEQSSMCVLCVYGADEYLFAR